MIKIFSEPPKKPCTYNISILQSPNITLFQLLMSILVSGARHLYGESISPNDITSEQFDELKCYMESVGYKIKYLIKKCVNFIVCSYIFNFCIHYKII